MLLKASEYSDREPLKPVVFTLAMLFAMTLMPRANVVRALTPLLSVPTSDMVCVLSGYGFVEVAADGPVPTVGGVAEAAGAASGDFGFTLVTSETS
jgi:hypothetical protein